MARLIARSAFESLLPLAAGTVRVRDAAPEAITSVAPLAGRTGAVSAALEQQIGLPFPAPNRAPAANGAVVAWSGLDQAMVLGPPLDPIDGAALTDQTDAWATCEIDGAAARDVLSRLVPIDLRPHAFEVGHAARTMLGHMSCLLIRQEADRYTILVFRSMAASAAHDLDRAMRMVAARP